MASSLLGGDILVWIATNPTSHENDVIFTLYHHSEIGFIFSRRRLCVLSAVGLWKMLTHQVVSLDFRGQSDCTGHSRRCWPQCSGNCSPATCSRACARIGGVQWLRLFPLPPACHGGLWRSISRSHMRLSDVPSTFGWIFEEIHPFPTIHRQETVRNRRDRTDRRTGIFLEACVQGKEAWMAFWELHGLYCLLSALLKRLEICSSAVQDYASFICFLPVHQAALLESCRKIVEKYNPFPFPQGFLLIFSPSELGYPWIKTQATPEDSDQLLPHLQARIAEKTKILMATYEVLPRPSAPPKRALFLEKCRALLHQHHGKLLVWNFLFWCFFWHQKS